jgi:transcriptional regulator with XRE-family HTH domain
MRSKSRDLLVKRRQNRLWQDVDATTELLAFCHGNTLKTRMPWFPVKGIVKRLRSERRWTADELARKAGVKARTVRLWESDNIPRTGHDDTVRGFAHAFAVANEVIATWHNFDPDFDGDGAGGDAPAKSTLARRAARDELREWVTLPGGARVELVRPRLLHRIATAPGLCTQRRYALAGKLRDHRDMPPVVAVVLNLSSPVCGQFLFVRRAHSGEAFYASAFSTTAEQTARLIDAAEAKQHVTALVRIEIREPDRSKEFKGFFVFQKRGETSKLYKWCFAVEDVVVGELPVELGDGGGATDDKAAKPRRSRAR